MMETPLTPAISLPPRLLRAKQVAARLGVAVSTLYRMMDAGSFPRPHEFSPGWKAWLEADVSAWIERAARDHPPSIN